MKKSPLRTKRIAIVTVIDNLSTSPSILNAISVLAEAGYSVDLVGRGFKDSMPNDTGWKNSVSFYLSPWLWRKGLPGIVALRHLLLIITNLIFRRPLAVIAVSPHALVLAGPVAVLLGLPLIHFSLEVRYPITFVLRMQKQIEKRIYRFVRFTIIQDKLRAKALLESNDMVGADLDMVYVPNTSGYAKPPTSRSAYLRERWNIPSGDVIILSAGNITLTMTLELAEAARKWRDDWHLIIHGWSPDPAYLDAVRAMCDGRHVILSTEMVPYEQLDDLFSSADIGVALYVPSNRNMLDMGLSSGKMWQYLRCSLPIISIDFPSLVGLTEEGRFGVCVSQPAEVESAIQRVLDDKEGFSARAREYYLRHGDFAASFKPVLDRLAGFE